jgi:predicted glycosyltransferase
LKIVQYSQHVLGVGHFFRSLELAKGLSGHDVILVSGGPPVEVELPAHVREIRFPGLVMDSEFRNIMAADRSIDLDRIKNERRERLLEIFEQERPDTFLVELYPFGRKAFRFELDPVLKGIRDGRLPRCRIVCSLRDILVEKNDQARYEERVIQILNSRFDALIIHSDPQWFRLDETFDRVADINVPLVYTGFVTPRPSTDARVRIREKLGLGKKDRLIVASAGGGKVGVELLASTIKAFEMIADLNAHLHVFTGPFMDEANRCILSELAGERVTIERFTGCFTDYLAAADLSVSLAGYNTTMNLLAAGTSALVYPFSQNREQGLRALRFADYGLLTVLKESDLESSRLADLIRHKPAEVNRPSVSVNLDGARHTARWFEVFMNDSGC